MLTAVGLSSVVTSVAPVVGRVAFVPIMSPMCFDQSMGAPSSIRLLASCAKGSGVARVAVAASPPMLDGYAARTAERWSESSWCTFTMVTPRQLALSRLVASAASLALS